MSTPTPRTEQVIKALRYIYVEVPHDYKKDVLRAEDLITTLETELAEANAKLTQEYTAIDGYMKKVENLISYKLDLKRENAQLRLQIVASGDSVRTLSKENAQLRAELEAEKVKLSDIQKLLSPQADDGNVLKGVDQLMQRRYDLIAKLKIATDALEKIRLETFNQIIVHTCNEALNQLKNS